MKKRQKKNLPSENPEDKKKHKRMNREMATVTYLVMALFVFMAGYVIWFLSGDTDRILNNSYNKRQDLMAERVTKGSILSDSGAVLAKTQKTRSGNEVRVYPYEGLFAHVVGRATHGKTGLEASESYTMLTSGINQMTALINELKGKKNPGNDVVTTLNLKMSQTASEALGSHRGAVVAMEPGTGKILCMVSKPTYDPNQLEANWERLTQASSDNSSLYNRATQGLYPPGSTFKLYTLLEYMRENEDFNKFSYRCTGKIGTGDGSIRCYGNEVHGKINLKQAFAESCNAAFAQIGSGLNTKSWTKLCEQFYYNTTLPIKELEQKSSRFSLDKASTGDIMQAAIGQGTVLTTPLQNSFLVSAVLNDGVLMKPYLVDRIQTHDGDVVTKNEPEQAKQLLSTEEAAVLRRYMRETVTSGTATALSTGNYKAGGKTGSAQYKAGSSDSHAWFVGYAVKGEKKLVVSIVVEGAGTGSAYAVPIARKIFDQYF